MDHFIHSFASPVYAIDRTWQNLGGEEKDVATIGSLVSLIKNVIEGATAFIGIVLFVMLVVGGLTFLFSGGDQKQVEKAKGTITNAVIGLVVLVCAYLILLLIQQFTGVEVTKLNLPFFEKESHLFHK